MTEHIFPAGWDYEDDTTALAPDDDAYSDDCSACGEECPPGECSESKRPCGHHCNHSWSDDSCCWCGQIWGGE